MGAADSSPARVITLPQGGGALRGLGEKFSADLFTGTGRIEVPITVPMGRGAMQPQLALGYSTTGPNGVFGLGWSLSVPAVARQTAHSVPRYVDERDTFILAGAEDLVPVSTPEPGAVEYRPRTEVMFARILHRSAPDDRWEVAARDGLINTYAARLTDPRRPERIFAWRLTRTRDPFGNLVEYTYDVDAGDQGGHRWSQPLLELISYADLPGAVPPRYVVTISFDYGDRQDPFSDYRAGFEIRTTRLCRSITTATHAERDLLVRRYEFEYGNDPYNGVSLLRAIHVVGFDDAGGEHRDLPPLEFGYAGFEPARRRLRPVRGTELPASSLAGPAIELVDVTGNGLPDVVELDGMSRFWSNLGAGVLDRPRPLRDVPAGLSLAQPGVQLLDADGDGRPDLLVTGSGLSGYHTLSGTAGWGRFNGYARPPSFGFDDPEVRLVDLDGNGVTDAVRAGTRFECYVNDPAEGWSGPVAATTDDPHGLPPPTFAGGRVRFADMTGDGLRDLVLIHDGGVVYWPNLGRGRWGTRVRMTGGPRLPAGYDAARLLLGDFDQDGADDLAYIAEDRALIWFNRSGNGWSAPVEIRGTPPVGVADTVHVADLLGTGVSGIVWSRDASAPGRPVMHVLDLTAGVKPRLLESVTNNLGATTRVTYAPSSRFAIADQAVPAFRWRTTLPFIVPVVARIEVLDGLSGGKIVTEYRYHHGYWDGFEREFRGFGCVEQVDTQTYRDYHSGAPARGVEERAFVHPTLRRTWFHLGAVAERDGRWRELDWSEAYWPGDPHLLRHTARVNEFLDGLGEPAARRAARDALRSLRGSILRTELYGLDGTARAGSPYTVTECAYGLRQEAAALRRVFFPYLAAQRTTEWERGDDPLTADPLTQVVFTGDHDAWGNARRRTMVALPRRSRLRGSVAAAVVGDVAVDETRILATHVRTGFATAPATAQLHDRVAETSTFELRSPPTVAETGPDDVRSVLADQLRAAEAVRDTFDLLRPTDVRLVSHVVNHYDGPGFAGLPAGELGPFGALTRTETLVFGEAELDAAYGDRRPTYLGGSAPPPEGAPDGFGSDLGYRRRPDGWYADTLRRRHDFQDGAAPARGLVLGLQDPLGHETRITPDPFWLVPARVVDAVGLETTAEYNYRVIQPRAVTDPSGGTTLHYRFHPLGLVSAIFVAGPGGQGGTADAPELRYAYHLDAWVRAGQPVSAHTTQRIRHASDQLSDAVIELREYSDGLGRMLQKRSLAETLTFGARGDDAGLLVPDATGTLRPVAGQARPTASGTRVADRVVVSGWQLYDNKGRTLRQHDSFYDDGWGFQPEEDASLGPSVVLLRDPRGHAVRTIHPDGSEERVTFGAPTNLSDPSSAAPSPWVVTTYDRNDLAPLCTRGGVPGGDSLAAAAPTAHHFTPATGFVDALGRRIASLVRNGSGAADRQLTRSAYDPRGNLVAGTDAHGRPAFSHAYDLTNRLLRTTSLDAGTRMTVLDAAGNTIESRDDRGAITLRTYDPLNRPRRMWARDDGTRPVTLREVVEYGDGADPDQPPAERALARAANQLGRIRRHLDDAGMVTVDRYDLDGNALTVARRVVSDAALAAGWIPAWDGPDAEAALETVAHVIRHRYDALGRVEVSELPLPGGAPPTRMIQTHGRSSSPIVLSLDDDDLVATVAFNARGQRVLIAYGNGLMTRCAYDPDTFRLVRLRTEGYERAGDIFAARGPVVQDLTYTYDLAGNITEIEDRAPGCGVAGTPDGRDRLVREFAYDPLYRLIRATGRACADIPRPRPTADTPRCAGGPGGADPADGTEPYTEAYDYDPAGNLLAVHHRAEPPGQPPVPWTRSFGLGGRPPGEWAAAADNRVTTLVQDGETRTLRYDAAGNLSGDGSRTLDWDYAGRLVRVTDADLTARYRYGSDGIRVRKWTRRIGTPAEEEATTALAGLVEHQRWSIDGGGESAWVHIGDQRRRAAIVRRGHAVPRDAGPATRYQLGDHLGSPAIVADADRTWSNREEFFPYGETSLGGFRRKRFRFTGQERDEKTGLELHRARYYSPWLGRWIAPDPAGHDDGLNTYAYVHCNPVGLTDPSGTQATSNELIRQSLENHGGRSRTGWETILPYPGHTLQNIARAGTEPADKIIETKDILRVTNWVTMGSLGVFGAAVALEMGAAAAYGAATRWLNWQLFSVWSKFPRLVLFAAGLVANATPGGGQPNPFPRGIGPSMVDRILARAGSSNHQMKIATWDLGFEETPIMLKLVGFGRDGGGTLLYNTVKGYVSPLILPDGTTLVGQSHGTIMARFDLGVAKLAPTYERAVWVQFQTTYNNLELPPLSELSPAAGYRSAWPALRGMTAGPNPVPEFKLINPVPIPDQPTTWVVEP
jgi:RHS repeat-associated protein